MYAATPGNFTINQGSLFGRFQNLAYKGPAVTRSVIPGVVKALPPRPSSITAGPAMLAGAGDGSRLAGQAIMTALAPKVSGPAAPVSIDPAHAFAEPGEAARQVLDRVGQTLAEASRRGAKPSELRDLARQAREGVAQGLAQARQTLEDMGVTKGSLLDQVDQTEGLLEQGLTDLAGRYLADPVSGPRSSTMERGAASRRSLRLEVTTREGDVVTLSLSDTRAFYQGASVTNTQTGSGLALQGAAYVSSSFSLTVDGELNQQEMDAIQSLMKKVDRLADRFFEGDVQAAFAKAGDTGLNSDALVSFSLSMEMSRVRQTSSAYQEVAAMDAAPPVATAATIAAPAAADAQGTPGPSLAKALDTLGGLFQDMQAAMEMPEVSEAFEKPGQIFRQLMGGAVQLHPAQDTAAAMAVSGGQASPAAVVDQVSAALEDLDADDHGDIPHDESAEGEDATR